MEKLRRVRPSRVVAVLALVLACTGSAIAAKQITGKQVKNESLSGRDIKNDSLTGRDVKEQTLTLPQGPQGPQGPEGPPATSLWAKVDADTDGASLINHSGATGASRVGAGIFKVTFDRPDVNGCAAVATRTDNSDGVAAPGEVSVEQEIVGSPSIFVRTFTSAGAPVDPSTSDGFSVHLYC